MKQQIDLLHSFSLKGDWFLPEEPNNRVSGEVNYSPVDGIHLELIGDFAPGNIGFTRNNYSTIIGIVEGSREITLFNCVFSGRGEMGLVAGNEIAKSVMHYSVYSMLDGWQFGSYNDLRAKTVIIEYDGLSEWLGQTGFNPDSIKIDHKAHTQDVHYELPKPIEFEFPKGKKAVFNFRLSNPTMPLFRTTLKMEQKASLYLYNDDGYTLDELFMIIYEFQTYLMLGLGKETCVTNVTLYNPDYSIQMSADSVWKRPIQLYYHQHYAVKIQDWDPRMMIFCYPYIRDNFQEIILRWDDLFVGFLPAISLMMEQYNETGMFSDNDFLNIAQAAETLHDRMHPGAFKMPKEEYAVIKKNILDNVPDDCKSFVQGLLQYGNNVSLSQRLKELVLACPQKVLAYFIPDDKLFVKEVLESRNYYTHYTMSRKKHVKQGQELMVLTNRVQVLLVINLLMYIGFSSDLIERMYDNQEYRLRWMLEN